MDQHTDEQKAQQDFSHPNLEVEVAHRDENYFQNIMCRSKYSTIENKGVSGLRQAKKIIIDCDPGGDDCQAMVLAFDMAKKRGIEVLGVTTVAGNGTLEHVVLNSQLILHACKELEVPIFRGEEPFGKGKELSEYFYGQDGFGETLLEYQKEHGKVDATNIRDESAVDFLIRIAAENPGEITILGLAPLTNLAIAQKKDPRFASNIRDVVLLGGTYLGQGNTDYFCSEFNFFKDAESAKVVFDNFIDITMVPIEACRVFRSMPQEEISKPFTQTQTVKGKLVHDSFRVALRNLGGHYETNDPLAVAVALEPEIALDVIEKCCYIENQGTYTKGMVIVDWWEIYPQLETGEALNQNPRRAVKIVTKINIHRLLDLMMESVLSD